MLNISGWRAMSTVEGPGRRSVLWVQGCMKRCPGCCNPLMLKIRPRRIESSDTVISWLARTKREEQIEGVTFLGGEPMLQAQGLAVVAEWCQDNGLSVMVFTGYSWAELQEQRLAGMVRLLGATDVLVSGPFIENQAERQRNWVGSTNQRFHYLSDRYGPDIETSKEGAPGVELIVRQEKVEVNGYPLLQFKRLSRGVSENQ